MAAPSDTGIVRLLGHQWVLDAIGRSLAEGRPSHAYLLTGPAQIGKFTTAMEIARLLLCPRPSTYSLGAGDPQSAIRNPQSAIPPRVRACGLCRHCRLAARRVHPDLQVLEIPSGRRNIPLQEVHEFLHGMALRPVEAARKVYIVRGADDLAEEGANTLLKTLEEPPRGVSMILTAPEPAAVLPTIVSRCQVIRLRPAATSEIASHLVEACGLGPARAEVVARASRGLPGWAIVASQSSDLLAERATRGSDLLRLLRSGRLERIQYADSLAERWSGTPDQVRNVLDIWMDVWRDALLMQQGLHDRVRNVDLADGLPGVAEGLSTDEVQGALESTLLTAENLDRNANPRLALETYLLLLPKLP